MKKLLLDENLPVPLAEDFSAEFDVHTVRSMNWMNKKNGELLTAMKDEAFDMLLTVDKNIPYQQNMDILEVKIVILRTYDNRYKTLKTHILTIEKAINESPDEEKILEIDLRD